MTRRQRLTRRFLLVLGGLVFLSGAVALVLGALKSNIVYFYGPSDLAAGAAATSHRLRLGGLVAAGSVVRSPGEAVAFDVTDGKAHVPVHYKGVLPDLFREGQGVVAEGRLGTDGVFQADTILAKHDERYMPRDVADALKKAGQWRPETSTPAPAGQGGS